MRNHTIRHLITAGALGVVILGGSAVAGAQTDTDADGIGDAEEIQLGTDPVVADSDGDGLTDGVEVALQLDPLAADSDGDGVSDPSEYLAGSDPLDPSSTPGGFGAVSPEAQPPAPPALAFDDARADHQRTTAWLLIALAIVGFIALSYTAGMRLVAAREVDTRRTGGNR